MDKMQLQRLVLAGVIIIFIATAMTYLTEDQTEKMNNAEPRNQEMAEQRDTINNMYHDEGDEGYSHKVYGNNS